MDFVAIDFETANYSRHSACAIGLTVVSSMAIRERRQFLIRPPSNSFAFTDLHGISWHDVKDQPTFENLWPTISSIIADKPLAAHNASFDTSVLQSTLEYYGLACPKIPCACSVQIARRIWPELSSHSLDAVADHLDLELNHHNALSDSEVCAKIVLTAALTTGHTSLIEMANALRVRYNYLLVTRPPKKKSEKKTAESSAQGKTGVEKPSVLAGTPDTFRYTEDVKALRIATAEAAKLVCEFRVKHGLANPWELLRAQKVLNKQIEAARNWPGPEPDIQSTTSRTDVVRSKRRKKDTPQESDDAWSGTCGILILFAIISLFSYCSNCYNNCRSKDMHGRAPIEVDNGDSNEGQPDSFQDGYEEMQQQILLDAALERIRQREERLQVITDKKQVLLEEQDELQRRYGTAERRKGYAWATEKDLLEYISAERSLRMNMEAIKRLEDEADGIKRGEYHE